MMKQTETAEPPGTRLTKLGVATAAGLLSGYLILLLNALLLHGLSGVNLSSTALRLSLFFGGWAFSALLLLRKSKTVVDIIAKGCLLGACEWLAVSLAAVRFTKNVPLISIAMSVFCLAGFGIALYLMRGTKEPSAYGEPPAFEDELGLAGDKQSVIVVLEFEDDRLAQSLTCITENVQASSGIDRLSA